tara:strand:- start:5815 stop:6567 length:753 start_codon:yes stop_codon:yes gene_type:complete
MKTGAIIWGLSENYNFTVYNKLGRVLKRVTEVQLSKLGITKENTAWLGTCYGSDLSREISIEFKPDGSIAHGSKDPRDFLKHFKSEGFRHLILLRLPILVGERIETYEYINQFKGEGLNNILTLMKNKDSIHYVASPNHLTEVNDDWDISPMILDLDHATNEFMLYNKPLANINEDNIKSYDFGSIGIHQGQNDWTEEDKAHMLLRVLESSTPDQEDIDVLSTNQVGVQRNLLEDILYGLVNANKEEAHA